MNKSELINAMAAESQLSKADAKKALEAFVSAVTGALKAGEKVSLVGFGTFSVSERAKGPESTHLQKKPLLFLPKRLQNSSPVRSCRMLSNRMLFLLTGWVGDLLCFTI